MSKKSLVIAVLSLVMVFLLSGCIDLFAVPGVAVSPDGSTIYFLGSNVDLMAMGEDLNPDTMILMSTVIGSGTTDNIALGDDQTFVGAFAVNPSNGDIAYVMSHKVDGTRIMLYNQAAGSRELVAAGALPNTSVATMMQFSPDGSKLALSLVQLPTADLLDNSDTLTPEQVQSIDSVLYVVDVNSGSANAISDAAGEWVNTLDWSPDSAKLAYNAWVDSDGDGNITIAGGFASLMSFGAETDGAAGDTSQIRVYDANSGGITNIDSTSSDYAAIFSSNSTLAYISLDTASIMMGGFSAVKVFDIDAKAVNSVHSADSLIMGLALSPDGSQVAWTEIGSESDAEGNTPAVLYLASPDFSDSRQVTQIENSLGFVDVPVWMPNGQSVLVSSTNFLSSIMGSFMGSFGSMMGDMATGLGDEEGAAEIEDSMDQLGQQVLQIDVNSGESSVIYEGFMTNSNLIASVLSLAGSEDMMGGLEGFQ